MYQPAQLHLQSEWMTKRNYLYNEYDESCHQNPGKPPLLFLREDKWQLHQGNL